MAEAIERHWRLVRVWIVVFSIATGLAHVHGYLLEQSDRERDRHDAAEDCVEDWEQISELRRGIPIPTEALIRTFPDADPADVDAFRSFTSTLLADTFSDPECDLDDALRELDG